MINDLEVLSALLIREEREKGEYIHNGIDWLSVEVAVAIQWHDPVELACYEWYGREEGTLKEFIEQRMHR